MVGCPCEVREAARLGYSAPHLPPTFNKEPLLDGSLSGQRSLSLCGQCAVLFFLLLACQSATCWLVISQLRNQKVCWVNNALTLIRRTSPEICEPCMSLTRSPEHTGVALVLEAPHSAPGADSFARGCVRRKTGAEGFGPRASMRPPLKLRPWRLLPEDTCFMPSSGPGNHSHKVSAKRCHILSLIFRVW